MEVNSSKYQSINHLNLWPVNILECLSTWTLSLSRHLKPIQRLNEQQYTWIYEKTRGNYKTKSTYMDSAWLCV